MPGLQPHQVQEIHELIHAKQIIQAIKVYREATGVGLAEAKQAVEEMAMDEAGKPPEGVRDQDNPVLEGKIKSLLAKRQKIEAVKIYRAEYGIGLKEAKDAVDRIEASMIREGSSMNVPYESAIGTDPFAADDGGGRRVVILLAAVVAVVVCGLALLVLMLNS